VVYMSYVWSNKQATCSALCPLAFHALWFRCCLSLPGLPVEVPIHRGYRLEVDSVDRLLPSVSIAFLLYFWRGDPSISNPSFGERLICRSAQSAGIIFTTHRLELVVLFSMVWWSPLLCSLNDGVQPFVAMFIKRNLLCLYRLELVVSYRCRVASSFDAVADIINCFVASTTVSPFSLRGCRLVTRLFR